VKNAMMNAGFRTAPGWRALALAAALLLPAAAHAQTQLPRAPTAGNTNRAAIPPSPSLSSPGSTTATRPHLDPGAMFCASADDLDRYQEILAARASGTTPPEGATPRCSRMSETTWIEILKREGPGRTEVRLAGTAGQVLRTGEKPADTRVGWTDVWLPPRQ
jgi:hypothetical protein